MQFYCSLILSICILTLSSCNYYGYTPTETINPGSIATHEAEGTRISHAVLGLTDKWNHENHLLLQDSAYHWRVDHPVIRLDFVSQDSLELKEARALLVDVVADLMGKLNGDIDTSTGEGGFEIREYPHFPYETSNIQIFIDFETYHGVFVDPYYVGWISLIDDMACFNAFNSQDNERDRWSYREELFWQSRDFVKSAREAKIAYDNDKKSEEPESAFQGLRHRPTVRTNKKPMS